MKSCVAHLKIQGANRIVLHTDKTRFVLICINATNFLRYASHNQKPNGCIGRNTILFNKLENCLDGPEIREL